MRETDNLLQNNFQEPKRIEINGIGIKEYSIGEAPTSGTISPGNMETGKTEQVIQIYKNEILLVNNFIDGQPVPYTFLAQQDSQVLGNYTNQTGQREFSNYDLTLFQGQFSSPEWTKELWDFARAKKPKIFTTDNKVACLRAIETQNGKVIFTIGQGLYSDSFYSNGSEGVTIGLNENDLTNIDPGKKEKLMELSAKLVGKYKNENLTIREIITSKYSNQLSDFRDHIYNNSIGVAGTVLTADNEFVFVKRGKNISINQGINCTASGAAEFDEKTLSGFGIQSFLGNEMARETNAELGFNAGILMVNSMERYINSELGINQNDYNLIPVGFIRELPRGGKPECMFLIRYKGKTEDLVKSIIKNPNSEKKEIDGSVYSFPSDQLEKVLKLETPFIQHKGLVNLMLCHEYLKNFPK